MSDLVPIPASAPSVKKYEKKPKFYSKKTLVANPGRVAAYVARKDYKSTMKEISPDAVSIIDQVLDPEDCQDLCRWPNTYGLSAVYKCKNIINASFSASSSSYVNGINRCCVAVYPRLNNAIFTTYGALTQYRCYAPAQLNTGFTNQNVFCVQHVSINTGDSVSVTSPLFAPIDLSGDAVLPVPVPQLSSMAYPVSWNLFTTGTAGNAFIGSFSGNSGVAGFDVVCNLYDFNYILVGTTLINFSQWNASTLTATNFGYNSFTAGGSSSTIAWMTMNVVAGSAPVNGVLQLSFGVMPSYAGGNSFIQFPNHPQHCASTSLKDATNIINTSDAAFVSSQSLLITFEGSSLNNGGQLAIARLPSADIPGEGVSIDQYSTWYSYLASLPYNNYDGPVKDGGCHKLNYRIYLYTNNIRIRCIIC